MTNRDGEIVLQTAHRLVVRGHLTTEEVRRLTGAVGSARQTWWRYAYTPLRQRQLITVPRGRFVEARGKGPGAFKVTVLDLRMGT